LTTAQRTGVMMFVVPALLSLLALTAPGGAPRWALGETPGGASVIGQVLASFDGDAITGRWHWRVTNDPVMGGLSSSTWAVQERVAVWNGTVVDPLALALALALAFALARSCHDVNSYALALALALTFAFALALALAHALAIALAFTLALALALAFTCTLSRAHSKVCLQTGRNASRGRRSQARSGRAPDAKRKGTSSASAEVRSAGYVGSHRALCCVRDKLPQMPQRGQQVCTGRHSKTRSLRVVFLRATSRQAVQAAQRGGRRAVGSEQLRTRCERRALVPHAVPRTGARDRRGDRS